MCLQIDEHFSTSILPGQENKTHWLTEFFLADVSLIKRFPFWIFDVLRKSQTPAFHGKHHWCVPADQSVPVTVPHEPCNVYITGPGLDRFSLLGWQTSGCCKTHQHALVYPDPFLRLWVQVALLQQNITCRLCILQAQAALCVVDQESLRPCKRGDSSITFHSLLLILKYKFKWAWMKCNFTW